MHTGRFVRVLLLIVALALLAAASAEARSGHQHTLRLRVPVPEAGDFSVLSFEMSIGAEGRHHRKQVVALQLVNHKETGVFAIARLHAEPGHPGRALGVIEVFHRSASAGAAASLLPALGGSLDAAPRARAARGYDELLVRAHNEHLIKEAIKDNIVSLANAHHLGPDDFCEPLSTRTYVLGNAIIGTAYVLAGAYAVLPTGTNLGQLADDAVQELCDEVEDDYEGDYYEDDEEEYGGIATLLHYLGAMVKGTTPPPASTYRLSLSGAFGFEGPNEVHFSGMFLGAYVGPGGTSTPAPPIDAFKVIVPAAGSHPRYVTNYICPSQLPVATVTTSTSPNDTLTCAGGSLPIGQQFSFNVMSVPPPTQSFGAMIIAHENGADQPALSIPGP